MALITCPECGRERVSDSAEACPECGYNIKNYYAKIEQAEKEKILAKEREYKKQEIENKYFGTSIKRYAWGLFAFLLFCLFTVVAEHISTNNKIEDTIESVERIEAKTSSIDNTLFAVKNGNIRTDVALEDISFALKEMDIDLFRVDNAYTSNSRVAEGIDYYVKTQTLYISWKEYKTHINDTYYIADTVEESAEIMIKK